MFELCFVQCILDSFKRDFAGQTQCDNLVMVFRSNTLHYSSQIYRFHDYVVEIF